MLLIRIIYWNYEKRSAIVGTAGTPAGGKAWGFPSFSGKASCSFSRQNAYEQAYSLYTTLAFWSLY
jgi:hypothetical protein